MKIMGLPNWLHWTAWFFKTFMFVMISVILIVVLMKVPWYPGTDLTVFSYTDPSLLLVYFIVYMIASICFFFMISVLFLKGNLVHNIVFFLAYFRHMSF
jgi:ATP-binding cassette subfamily A (ABC1) protein 3